MSVRRLTPLNAPPLASPPAAAREGDVYVDTTSKQLRRYQDGAWRSNTQYVVSDTAPVDPLPGTQWFESDSGRVFTWFGTAWVEVTENTAASAPSSTAAMVVSASDPSAQIDTSQYLWIQTGIGDDGTGVTFWIEDGL